MARCHCIMTCGAVQAARRCPALAGFAHREKCEVPGRVWLFDSDQTLAPGRAPSNPLNSARSPFRVPRYQSAESRKLSICSRCRRRRRPRHHSNPAKTAAETTHASQMLRGRPVMAGVASQSTVPSIARTSVAIKVTRMVRGAQIHFPHGRYPAVGGNSDRGMSATSMA